MKVGIGYLLKHPSYLTSRAAIETEILFAVCLSKCGFWSVSVKTPPEKSPCSKKIGAESAVSILVYFYILCNNKNYKKASEGLSYIEAMKHADSVANEYLNKTLEDNEL